MQKPFLGNLPSDAQDIRQNIVRLEALVADLKHLLSCSLPTVHSALLSHPQAPLLDDWQFSMRPVICLQGMSTGHPSLPGTRRPIRTSELWLISEEFGWARTYSRFYRLGNRLDTLTERH